MKFTIIASVLAYANSSTDQLLTKARDITLACLLFSLALTLNGLQLNAQTGFLNHEYTWTESFSCFGSQWTETYRYTIDSVSTDINGKDYFELLVSETYLGNNFEGTGKFIRSDDSNRVFSYDGELEKILWILKFSTGINLGEKLTGKGKNIYKQYTCTSYTFVNVYLRLSTLFPSYSYLTILN